MNAQCCSPETFLLSKKAIYHSACCSNSANIVPENDENFSLPMASTSQGVPEHFYTVHLGETQLVILKRYQNLRLIGSGAQGIVWYVLFADEGN